MWVCACFAHYHMYQQTLVVHIYQRTGNIYQPLGNTRVCARTRLRERERESSNYQPIHSDNISVVALNTTLY